MTPRLNFAPFSSAPSGMLRFASGYFLLNGVLYGLFMVALLVAFAIRSEEFFPSTPRVLAVLVQVITAVGLVWTGSLLARGARLGGLLALGFLLLPIVFSLVARHVMSTTNLVVGTLGAIVVLMVWHELK